MLYLSTATIAEIQVALGQKVAAIKIAVCALSRLEAREFCAYRLTR
ncbi:hypothetical protein [Fischerella sp. PCC 9605]|nr:hypothetical protein [Fischerella sp. PCC 9605]